ncbi:Pterin-4-alpha-carbinolamine dehydratase 2 protein [Thalictrum thalictroides]|uniref:4a-hydroxytetrahydrobiopterin dehydratase n=1 Tax=Thalictrum thalictroides TaxID=46969 RepID=A0A7J6WIL6_THATH|nr:Pterin-4-alpha-carbinolamine dehydratase 2 protein [Thalictrum thalictroides]
MAMIIRLNFSTSLLPISLSSSTSPNSKQHPRTTSLSKFPNRRRKNQILATGGEDLLGDFGGRDPFPAEIESQFGNKVVGNFNTEHKILIPNLSSLSLAQQQCTQVTLSQSPMSAQDAQQLIRKVIGWRLVDTEGSLRLQCLWKLRDYKSAVELINRIYHVVEDTKHYPNLHLEQPNQVRAELWTTAIGGLSMNDFIVAAKIDEIQTSDLVPKRRAWA